MLAFFILPFKLNYGFLTVLGLSSPLAPGFEFELLLGVLTEFAFCASLICFLRVASSGIPGVGVAPFGSGLPGFSGIPGVGVAPFGRGVAFTGGIPGVEFPEGGIGEVEIPGGKFAGSMFPVAFAELAFELVPVWHARFSEKREQAKTNKIFFVIDRKYPQNFSF
jgi:hypothetical protein